MSLGDVNCSQSSPLACLKCISHSLALISLLEGYFTLPFDVQNLSTVPVDVMSGEETKAVLTLGKSQEIHVTCHRKDKEIHFVSQLSDDGYRLMSGLLCSQCHP